MKLHLQAKNFLRVLLRGAPGDVVGSRDPLATTASHLRIVNMSVEDDRLASPESNAQYTKSLE